MIQYRIITNFHLNNFFLVSHDNEEKNYKCTFNGKSFLTTKYIVSTKYYKNLIPMKNQNIYVLIFSPDQNMFLYCTHINFVACVHAKSLEYCVYTIF